jgi:hypothetical protein
MGNQQVPLKLFQFTVTDPLIRQNTTAGIDGIIGVTVIKGFLDNLTGVLHSTSIRFQHRHTNSGIIIQMF